MMDKMDNPAEIDATNGASDARSSVEPMVVIHYRDRGMPLWVLVLLVLVMPAAGIAIYHRVVVEPDRQKVAQARLAARARIVETRAIPAISPAVSVPAPSAVGEPPVVMSTSATTVSASAPSDRNAGADPTSGPQAPAVVTPSRLAEVKSAATDGSAGTSGAGEAMARAAEDSKGALTAPASTTVDTVASTPPRTTGAPARSADERSHALGEDGIVSSAVAREAAGRTGGSPATTEKAAMPAHVTSNDVNAPARVDQEPTSDTPAPKRQGDALESKPPGAQDTTDAPAVPAAAAAGVAAMRPAATPSEDPVNAKPITPLQLQYEERIKFRDEIKRALSLDPLQAGPLIDRASRLHADDTDPARFAQARKIWFFSRTNQKEKVRLLRALGLPESVILDFISADLHAHIGARGGPRNAYDVRVRAAKSLLSHDLPAQAGVAVP